MKHLLMGYWPAGFCMAGIFAGININTKPTSNMATN